MTRGFSLSNKTKGKLPRLPFARMKDEVLGKDYELSLVFVGDAAAKKLNMEHRGADYVPNVLAFELDKASGEIFINPIEAKRQAPDFGRTHFNFIAFLYVHALCHLKGMEHGSRMEKTEETFRKLFGI